jgi:hypothetical protein
VRHRIAAFLFAVVALGACGSDLSGLKTEDEYPYNVNLIFELASDTSLECLPLAGPCQVRLKGNVTSRWGQRVVGAPIYARINSATTFTQLVTTNQSGIFNITIALERGAEGRKITLCSGATVDVAITGSCPTLSL